jgi:kynurenine 3-monooxygenase
MGDAAHAIVPFYGQGMNASFEDVLVLDQLMDSGIQQWNELFEEFATTRKKDADAIANLALDNFHEMKEHTADPIFQRKRSIEVRLEQERPRDYQSKYSMVTFRPELTYHQAMTRGRAQDKAIEQLLRENKLHESQDLEQQLRLIQQQTQRLMTEKK